MKPGDFLTKKSDYPTGDTADVFRAVLDTLYTSADGSPPVIVLYAETEPRMVGCAKLPCPLLTPQPSTPLGVPTMEAFRQATLSRRHLKDFNYRLPVRIMSEEQQLSILAEGQAMLPKYSNREPFWVGLLARYPGTWGIARLSAVGMNPEKTEALLQVRHQCGAECESSELMILKKMAGRWQVVERLAQYTQSPDAGKGSLRFRGVGAPAHHVDPREVAAAESLRVNKAPRDIHGVLTNGAYGEPIKGAAVTVAPYEEPNKKSAKVYSDSTGAYTIENPPIGYAYIDVRCPQGTQRPDGVMAITAGDVKADKRLVFNMSIDARSCDDPYGTPHNVQPPFDAPPMGNAADSARARKATYPSAEEAEVYKTVLSGLGVGGADKITLLYATTRSQCGGADCAEQYYRRIRFVPEVMLSTMENFLSVREKRLDLKDGVLGIPGVVLFGDSTLTLLEQAMGQSDLLNNWSLIRMAWPSVEGVVQVSPVAFSPHHKQAMVELSRGDKIGGQSGELWIVEKQPGGDWRIVKWFR